MTALARRDPLHESCVEDGGAHLDAMHEDFRESVLRNVEEWRGVDVSA